MRLTNWLPNCVLVAALTTVGCTGAKMAHNLPPSSRLMEPGPGVGGPGPGVIPAPGQPGVSPGAMQASFVEDAGFYGGGAGCYAGPGGAGPGMPGMGMPGMGMPATSQISFLGEEPLQISWDVSGAGTFDSTPLLVPGKQDFPQGAIYRLRVSNLPGRETVVLYPTLEVAPVTPRTDAYLAHAPIPVQFTEEDFDQVLSGNFVTKVIYLPDPEFTEVALAGVETLVSTRLDPGVDPIAEADRRGSILAILRMGNKDLSQSAGMFGPGGPGGPGGAGGAGGPCVVPAEYQNGEYLAPGESLAPTMEGEYMGSVDGGYVDGGYAGGGHVDEGYIDGGYGDGGYTGGPAYGGNCPDGNCYGGDGCYAGGGAYGGVAANMPVGAPTAGNRPQSVPPHMIANMSPQWGMPHTGTPIGLPGPPHIPLGVPAGLKKHSMRNRTRVVLPEPVNEFKMSVKQRPGMNYPGPVDKVHIDEVNRAPTQLFGGTVPGIIPSALNRSIGALKSAAHNGDCQCEYCQ